MNKLGTAIGGLLLIGALAAPVAFAHYDSGFGPAASAFGAPAGNNENRVAGWYYGSTNTYTELDSAFEPNPLGGPRAECSLLVDPAVIAACQALTGPLNPGFLFAQWGGLGDVEVGGSGTCGEPVDETVVDGNRNGAQGGQAPDGSFHDGGHGYITHTDHYDCTAYNTAGCNYAPATGSDLVSGGDLWLGTQCNWGIPVGDGIGLVGVVLQFVGDVVNCPLGGFPQSCLDAVNYLLDCLGVTVGGSCGDSNDTIVCGNGSVSTTNFGVASDGVAFPSAGVDSNSVNCDSQATASVFPFTALVVNQNSAGTPSLGHASVATVGWVG